MFAVLTRKFRPQSPRPLPMAGPHPTGSRPLPAPTTVKGLAMLYLDATLAVLRREHIPLAQPVHGPPARGARWVELPIRLDRRRIGPMAMRKALGVSTLNAIKAAAGVSEVNIWQQCDALIYQYQLTRPFWKFYKRADLPSPAGIGLGVGHSLIPFQLSNRNTLVAGETRSGKSVTIESIIFSIMQSHSPQELGLVLIDPNQTFGLRKDGLQAIEVGRFTNAAHLLRPVAYSTEQIAAAIDYVYGVWKHRSQNGIQDAPGIVLVIDELMSEAVIGDKDSGNYHALHLEKLTHIASQGIKNNIFLVVGAQDPRVGNTSGLFMRNLGLRFIGRVTDGAASRALAGRGGVNAHLLTGNGDFIQVNPDSQLRFQVAEPGRIDFDRLERRPMAEAPVEPVDLISPLPADQEEDEDAPGPALDPLSLLADPGEPQVCVDAYTLAIYFYEKQLSIRQARSQYGIYRRVHQATSQYALELQEELARLRSGKPPRSPYYQKIVEA